MSLSTQTDTIPMGLGRYIKTHHRKVSGPAYKQLKNGKGENNCVSVQGVI